MKVGKIFASAGCGKTTALLELLDQRFANGVKPQEVLFTTFTRAGAYEARDRAISKFANFGDKDFPYFRTLHSLCFRAIVAPPIMRHSDYIQVGKMLHVRFGSAGLGEELYERGKGDALLGLYNLQRNKMSGVNLVPEEHGIRASKEEYDHFIRTYDHYRNERGLYDYTDLLEEVWADGLNGQFSGLPIRFAFIDEAQDLTRLQYEVVKVLVRQAEEIWYAGDDDQCIFSYSGADPDILINMQAQEQVVLEKSYRLPVPVARYANGVANRIQIREHKYITSYDESTDQSERITYSNNFTGCLVDGERTTILCRNRAFFGYFEEYLQQRGILYSFVKATEMEEKLDVQDQTQIRRAIMTWKDMLENPTLEFSVGVLQQVTQFIPTSLWRKSHRRVIMKGDENQTYCYQTLVNDHNLFAQDVWQKTLTEIPYELKQYMETLDDLGKLDDEPTIKIGTIHSFKGKEDDHIVVLPDMSYQTWQTYQDTPDAEHRVFFVGVTRAKERLTLLDPITKYHYDW